MENKNDIKVYSYHTFYFPFIWDNGGSLSIDGFSAGLTQNGKWKDISVTDFTQAAEDKVANYQTLQFFTPAARKSLFGWNEKFVRCFEYSGIQNKAKYYILNKSSDQHGIVVQEYKLNLDGIKLKVYNTGIAVLTFEAENTEYRTLEDVKNINEYGRRIFAPYFVKKNICDACAAKLGIKFEKTVCDACAAMPDLENEKTVCDFCSKTPGQINEINICDTCAIMLGIKFETKDVLCPISQLQPKTEEECIPNFITLLIPGIKIIPAIDDRMFVACLVNDAEEFKKHLDYSIDDKTASVKDVHLNYKTNEAASKSLYEFLYIDRDDNCSCPTQKMRNELLEQSIYSRWAEYTVGGQIAGTIHGITHHSMVCLTSATLEYVAERPFLTIYAHMISIVLAQRASILAFDNKISKCSRDFENKNNKIGMKQIEDLKNLQDSYIAFLNQHMNIEVTCQEQGIELYKMLQKEMYVNEEAELLSKELALLNDAANIASDIRNNKLAILLTVLFGIISALPLTELIKYLWEKVYSLMI